MWNVVVIAVVAVSVANAEPRCLISQTGADGFGHQLLGKLSFGLFQEMGSTATYVHVPMYHFDHVVLDPAHVDQFLNMKAVFPEASDFPIKKRVNVNHLMPGFFYPLLKGTAHCDPDTLYMADNTWDVTFKDHNYRGLVDGIVRYSKTFRALREAYHSTPKPDLNFKIGRPNIVMHIRRGDALARSFPEAFYNKALDFYANYFGEVPYLIIATDDPGWTYTQDLLASLGENATLASPHILGAFHQMVMADGLIVAESSFSTAAVFYRNLTNPIVGCQDYTAPISAYVYIC
jgi:hypothetical protein